MTCRILTCNKNVSLHTVKNLKIQPNKFVLCLIINNKKVFYDIEQNELLKFNNILSTTNYNCYSSIFNNKSLYYVNDIENINMELNNEHLFAFVKYIFSDEYTKKEFGSKIYVEDYIKFLDETNIDLLKVSNDNIDIISKLNIKISEEQNKIYKKVKKI